MRSDHPTPPIPSHAPYAFGLDLVRFGCALMVALFHFTWRTVDEAHVMPFGWIGVQVFFVVSGVVIANSALASTPYRFVRSRFLRLYPAAWIAAAISFAILALVPWSAYQALGIGVIPQLGALARSLTLVGDYALATSYWTLPIEIAFYLLVLTTLLRRGIGLRAVARLLALASSAYLIALSYALAATSGPGWLDLGYGMKNMLLLRHGVFFAIGIYVWIAVQQRRLERSDCLLLVLCLATGALEIICRALTLMGIYAVGEEGRLGLTPVMLGALLVFGIMLALICLSLVNARRWTPAPRMGAFVRMLGLVTYPFYLVHEVAGGAILHAALGHGLGRPAGLALALAGALGLAWLIAAFAEPALRNAIIHTARWTRGHGLRLRTVLRGQGA